MEVCLVKFHRDVWECKGHMARLMSLPLITDWYGWYGRLGNASLFPYSSKYLSPEAVYFVKEDDLAWGEEHQSSVKGI